MKTFFMVLAILGDLVLIAGSLVMLPISVMMFDSGETPLLWTIFYAMLAIPVLALVGVIGGPIVRFALHNQDLALWLAAAPLIYTLLFGIFFILASAVA